MAEAPLQPGVLSQARSQPAVTGKTMVFLWRAEGLQADFGRQLEGFLLRYIVAAGIQVK